MLDNVNLRPIPFERGNSVARRHGFYATVSAPVENEEITELADAVRELSPLDAEALEPLIASAASSLFRSGSCSRWRSTQRAATRGWRRGSFRETSSVSSSASIRLS
jgi:hypothetical protein